MRPTNSKIISGFPSQTSSTSGVIWANDIVRASFQVTVSSGSLNGTFVLEGSNDQATGTPMQPGNFLPTNWNTIGGSTSVICSTTGANGCFLIGATELAYEYLRLKFTVGNAGAALGLYSVRMKSLGL